MPRASRLRSLQGSVRCRFPAVQDLSVSLGHDVHLLLQGELFASPVDPPSPIRTGQEIGKRNVWFPLPILARNVLGPSLSQPLPQVEIQDIPSLASDARWADLAHFADLISPSLHRPRCCGTSLVTSQTPHKVRLRPRWRTPAVREEKKGTPVSKNGVGGGFCIRCCETPLISPCPDSWQ